MRGTYRSQPVLIGRPEQYQTYSLSAPLATHWRPVTCAEVECDEYVRGFAVVVPVDSPQADYVRADRTRRHRESRTPDGLARFEFEPGTAPFSDPRHDHRAPTGRPPLYLVRPGAMGVYDRAATRVHSGPDPWVDDCRTHLERLAKERE